MGVVHQEPSKGLIRIWFSTHVRQTTLAFLPFISSRTAGKLFSLPIKIRENPFYITVLWRFSERIDVKTLCKAWKLLIWNRQQIRADKLHYKLLGIRNHILVIFKISKFLVQKEHYTQFASIHSYIFHSLNKPIYWIALLNWMK